MKARGDGVVLALLRCRHCSVPRAERARGRALPTPGFLSGELLEGILLEPAIKHVWGEEDVHGRSMFVVSGWYGVGYSAHVIHLPDEDLHSG